MRVSDAHLLAAIVALFAALEVASAVVQGLVLLGVVYGVWSVHNGTEEHEVVL